MLYAFVKLFTNIADTCAPMIHKRIRGTDTPWITGDIKKLMAMRDKTKQDAIRTKSTDLFSRYKEIKNAINKLCKKARCEYYSNLITESMDKPHKLWKAIKKVLPGKTKQSTTILQDEEGIFSKPPEVANCFNRFFTNIGFNLASKFPSGLQISNPYPNFKQTFYFKPININYTLKELQTLKTSKATGLDNISARLLRDAAVIVADPLNKIMNHSLKTGIVPSVWKEARVSPIFKSDCPTSPSNYRPVSIIPVCMKIFERAVQIQLVSYLTEHSILYHQQSGFRKKHSTQTAITDVTDYILSNMDNGNLTGAVYLDLKKAFDTVDLESLLFKLQCLGIGGDELKWFNNYINDRRQCVQHATSVSEKLPISCGVPQGSILGPTLFTLFLNDIVTSVSHAKIVLYADDTILLFSAKTTCDIKSILNGDLKNVSAWFQRNKLHLNTKKCKWTLFGSEKRLSKISLPEICIGEENMEHVTNYKYFGVQLDSNLKWESHIELLCSKVRQRLGVLKRTRDYLDQATALKLYNALVMPLIDYCDVTYSTCSSKYLKKIERLMLRGGKIVLNVPYDTPSIVVLNRLKWLTLKERTDYHKCVQMYKCINSLSPAYLSDIFDQVNHGYSTRNSCNLKIVKCKTQMGQRSFKYIGATLWNSLPHFIRTCSSLNEFKQNILKYFLNTRS